MILGAQVWGNGHGTSSSLALSRMRLLELEASDYEKDSLLGSPRRILHRGNDPSAD